MKKTIFILVGLIIIVSGYFVLSQNKPAINGGIGVEVDNSEFNADNQNPCLRIEEGLMNREDLGSRLTVDRVIWDKASDSCVAVIFYLAPTGSVVDNQIPEADIFLQFTMVNNNFELGKNIHSEKLPPENSEDTINESKYLENAIQEFLNRKS